MNEKTKGAWIIHHTYKLTSVQLQTGEYERINFAGKCGIILSGLAATKQITVLKKRVETIASAAGISTKLELPTILEELNKQRLIEIAGSEISVLGLTTTTILEHTSKIFTDSQPSGIEMASILVSEDSSKIPIREKDIIEKISDLYRIKTDDCKEIIYQFQKIGFVDAEKLKDEKVLFNGNLFRKNEVKKISAVLSALSTKESSKVNNLLSRLNNEGCLSYEEAILVTGEKLLEKLISIGFIDVNSIGNERGIFKFVTHPAAFKKFTSASNIDDAFDLAKAFVTSLTFGMKKSPISRGRIRMIEALMKKLIDGQWIGPATAIGQDYKILELKGVIQVRSADDNMFYMRLLKKDVGELAYKVITEGEASSSIFTQLPSVSASKYGGPESHRVIIRKKQVSSVRKSIGALLDDLRTGGIK